MTKTTKNRKSRIIGTHTTGDRHFLVTNAHQRRIRHTHILAPKTNPRSQTSQPQQDFDSDVVVEDSGSWNPEQSSGEQTVPAEDCPAGLKIKQRAKRYVNSVSQSHTRRRDL